MAPDTMPPKLISPGQSAFHLSSSASSGPSPLNARRRSTETSGSGTLDYYWSNAAGAGPSSSSSSLATSSAMSPSPSAALLDNAPFAGMEGKRGLYRRSETSLKDLIAAEEQRQRGQAARREEEGIRLESPSVSVSGESDYSSSGSLPLGMSANSPQSGHKRIPAEQVWNVPYDPARQSMASTATAKATPRADGDRGGDGSPTDRTPVVVQHGDRPNINPPPFTYASDSVQATPIVSQTNFGRSQPSPSSYTPGSGRLGSGGPRRGGSPPSTQGTGSGKSSPVIKEGIAEEAPVPEPQSAPPTQGEFGLGMGPLGAEEDTLKGKARDKRSTLPAMPAETAEYLSPEKQTRGGGSPRPPPRSALRTQLAGITSPLPNLAFDYSPSPSARTTSPLNVSPPTRDVGRLSLSSSSLTSSPPMSREHSSDLPRAQPHQDLRHRGSTSDSASVHSPASIHELTDLLGGAIGEIGLMDSRETPPPMIAADSRDKSRPANISVGAVPNGNGDNGPITPGSLPNRGGSLSSTTSSAAGSVPAPNVGNASFPVEQANYPLVSAAHQRQTSTSTLHAPTTVTAAGFQARPWPAAMLFGHIKNMKHSGDRAKYYARGINDLAVADSGIRDWCVISASSAHRVPPARMPLHRLQSNMTNRSDFAPSIHIQPAGPSSISSAGRTATSAHPRTVSSSSEFPMREDSYSAREISQRVIDPGDEPTSLPPNLPYPQLQQVRSGGMRASPSMASMTSMTSTSTSTTVGGSGGGGKRGFFGALRGKKESPGLGPPTGPIIDQRNGAAAKKDVRGLQISNPERTSLPMGPRGPRGAGGIYPSEGGEGRHSLETAMPYRGSLDAGSGARFTPTSSAAASRSSFDLVHPPAPSAPLQRSNLGSRLQQAATGSPGGGSGGNTPKEEDVRAMQEVLPHVDRGVLRAYLGRYGDQMGAITAYFEDEKRGAVRA